MKLREYQHQCLDEIFGDLAECASTLAVLPTGTGKTIIFSHLSKQWEDGRVLIVAHREELIYQAVDKIERVTGQRPAVEMANLRADEADGWIGEARLVVASIQSLNAGPRCKSCVCPNCSEKATSSFDEEAAEDLSEKATCSRCNGLGCLPGCPECMNGRRYRMLNFDPHQFGLVIVDEAHHSTARTYRRVLDYFRQNKDCKIVGVTATPDRADEEALGQVFESVAFTYEIPDAIRDGWLVDIEQQYVVVEDLDFSTCRTTAGDLNGDDLERVMMAEKALHGVVNPTIELAGDMPTLIFTASVAHAERVAEIINRHRKGSATCLHGKTPSEKRREELLRYKNGEYQFLVNCGLFLEGFDESRIACVAVARPTKSRALYAQMIGRGTRSLPGVVDNDWMDGEGRREAIACSSKPALLVLDFVGNAGRHKLISTADILGGNVSDEIVDMARATAAAQSANGQRVNMATEIRAAQERAEEEARRRRRMVTARASYSTQKINPFDVFEMTSKREPGWHKGRLPSEKQLEVLRKNGLEADGVSFWQANQLITEIFDRREKGKCTFKQAKLLAKFGYSSDTSFDEARGIIDKLAANNWKRPKEAG